MEVWGDLVALLVFKTFDVSFTQTNMLQTSGLS